MSQGNDSVENTYPWSQPDPLQQYSSSASISSPNMNHHNHQHMHQQHQQSSRQDQGSAPSAAAYFHPAASAYLQQQQAAMARSYPALPDVASHNHSGSDSAHHHHQQQQQQGQNQYGQGVGPSYGYSQQSYYYQGNNGNSQSQHSVAPFMQSIGAQPAHAQTQSMYSPQPQHSQYSYSHSADEVYTLGRQGGPGSMMAESSAAASSSGSPYGLPGSLPLGAIRPKRKQVKNACVNCQKACKKCDESRPCLRCVKYGVAGSCQDSARKERKRGIKRGPYKRRATTGSAPQPNIPGVTGPLDGRNGSPGSGSNDGMSGTDGDASTVVGSSMGSAHLHGVSSPPYSSSAPGSVQRPPLSLFAGSNSTAGGYDSTPNTSPVFSRDQMERNAYERQASRAAYTQALSHDTYSGTASPSGAMAGIPLNPGHDRSASVPVTGPAASSSLTLSPIGQGPRSSGFGMSNALLSPSSLYSSSSYGHGHGQYQNGSGSASLPAHSPPLPSLFSGGSSGNSGLSGAFGGSSSYSRPGLTSSSTSASSLFSPPALSGLGGSYWNNGSASATSSGSGNSAVSSLGFGGGGHHRLHSDSSLNTLSSGYTAGSSSAGFSSASSASPRTPFGLNASEVGLGGVSGGSGALISPPVMGPSGGGHASSYVHIPSPTTTGALAPPQVAAPEMAGPGRPFPLKMPTHKLPRGGRATPSYGQQQQRSPYNHQNMSNGVSSSMMMKFESSPRGTIGSSANLAPINLVAGSMGQPGSVQRSSHAGYAADAAYAAGERKAAAAALANVAVTALSTAMDPPSSTSPSLASGGVVTVAADQDLKPPFGSLGLGAAS